MSYEEVDKKIWELYQYEMSSRNNDDYAVNEIQMRKLIDAYAFFVEIAERDGGKVDQFHIEPKEVCGGITAYFTLFYIDGKDIDRLVKVVRNMSAISIDSMSDGDVCISFTIPDVFYKK